MENFRGHVITHGGHIPHTPMLAWCVECRAWCSKGEPCQGCSAAMYLAGPGAPPTEDEAAAAWAAIRQATDPLE